MSTGAVLAAAFLVMVAIGHLLRLLLQVELVANGHTLPMWISIPPILRESENSFKQGGIQCNASRFSS